MKHIFTILILGVLATKINAQINFEGAAEYGRLSSIIYDPDIENKLYALSVGNHLMTSSDDGQTWNVLYTFPYSIVDLSELKYREDRTLSFIVNNTVSEDGIYIFDLETENITQLYIPPIPADSYRDWVQAYSIYPNNSDIAIVLQNYMNEFGMARSKVYKTSDGGANWEEIYFSLDFDSVSVSTVAIAPNNPEKFYLVRSTGAMTPQGGILISQDGGSTWSESLAGITFLSIAFSPNDPNIVWVGSEGGVYQEEQLYKSIDGGNSWELINIPWSPTNNNVISSISINPYNVDNMIILESNEIAISENGGVSWENYVYPPHQPELYSRGNSVSFDPYEPDKIILNASWYPMISSDGGANLELLPVPFHRTIMVGLFPQNQDHLYYYLQEGIVHRNRTTGAVESFDVESIDLENDLFNETRYYVDSRTFGRIYSFSQTNLGSFLNFSNSHGGNKIELYQTFFDDVRALSVDPIINTKVWVSFRDEGLVNFDFSDLNQIEKTTLMLPEPGIVYEIHFDSSTGKMWIGLNNKLFVSTDEGNNWTECGAGITLMFDEVILNISHNTFNSQEMIAATSNGIYRSEDGGNNWLKVFTGINVSKIAYSPVTNGHIVASIYTRDTAEARIVYSVDSGLTWTAVPFEDIYNIMNFSMDYYFNENSVDVYMASKDLGILKLNKDLNNLDTPQYSTPKDIFVYPNPTKDVVFIDANSRSVNSISVYNSLGTMIAKYPVYESISLADLSPGVYFMIISTKDGDFLKRIIKE